MAFLDYWRDILHSFHNEIKDNSKEIRWFAWTLIVPSIVTFAFFFSFQGFFLDSFGAFVISGFMGAIAWLVQLVLVTDYENWKETQRIRMERRND